MRLFNISPEILLVVGVQMRDIVRQLAQLFPTAIISGRGREKLEKFVQLKEMFYAGSHGLDILGPRVCSPIALISQLERNETFAMLQVQHNRRAPLWKLAQIQAATFSAATAAVSYVRPMFCSSQHDPERS